MPCGGSSSSLSCGSDENLLYEMQALDSEMAHLQSESTLSVDSGLSF